MGTFLIDHRLLLLLLGLRQNLVLSELGDQTFLLLPDLRQVHMHLIVPLLWLISSSCLAFLALATFFSAIFLHLCFRCLLQLRKRHLRPFRVLLKNALISLIPFVEDVLKALISLSLGSLDQVTNLHALLSQLHHALVVLAQDLSLAHLELLEVTFFLGCQCLLLARLRVDRLGQDSLLLLQVLKLLR